MNVVAVITAIAKAVTAYFMARPLALALRINKECEQLTEDIMIHEGHNTAPDAILADKLRIKLAYRRKLHDSLLAALPQVGAGDSRPNIGRAIPVSDA